MKKLIRGKKRPVRIFLSKTGKYYFLQNGKKKYLNLNHPQSKHGNHINQKQIVKVVINHPKAFRNLKKRKRVKKDIDKIKFSDKIIKPMTKSDDGTYSFTPTDAVSLHNRIVRKPIEELNTRLTSHFPQIEHGNIHSDIKQIDYGFFNRFFNKRLPDIEETVSNLRVEEIDDEESKKTFQTIEKDLEKIDELQNKFENETITKEDKNKIIDLTDKIKKEVKEIEKRRGVKQGTKRAPYNKKQVDFEKLAKNINFELSDVPQIYYINNGFKDSEYFAENADENDYIKLIKYMKQYLSRKEREEKKKTENPASKKQNNKTQSKAEETKTNPQTTNQYFDKEQQKNNPFNETNTETNETNTETNDNGGGIKMSKDGLYDYQIEEILNDKTKAFVPVISSDQILSLSKYIKKPKGRFCFVMNTDSSRGKGKHWVSCCIDWDNCDICYYDSLADDPTQKTLNDLHTLIMKFRPSLYLKLKVNRVKQQSDSTANCGWFASNFVISMLRGANFSQASLYDKIKHDEKNGEKKIEAFKRSFL